MSIKKCSCVASVSHYTRASILEQAQDIDSSRCIVFPNALSQYWIDLQSEPSEETTVPELPECFVLSVTRLAATERYKGIVSTIEGLAGVDDNKVHYVIAGKGEDVMFLKRVAERCGVENRVHVISNLTDAQLAVLYRKALAFVLPSGKEGFGIVYLEAMYFGLPVIAARARGAIDVVRDEQTGLLVEYGDVSSISSAIERLSRDASFRNKLVVAGKQLVTGNGEFTANAMESRWKALLA